MRTFLRNSKFKNSIKLAIKFAIFGILLKFENYIVGANSNKFRFNLILKAIN